MSKFIGIDISKNTFDLAYQKQDKWVFTPLSNDQKGFKSLLKHLDKDDWVVMEASGPYGVPLATYLYEKGYQVALENPFAIKSYSQMMLYRTKTDKKDAKTIAEYAGKAELRPWKPAPAVITELRHLQTAVEGTQKAIHQTSRQVESLKSSGLLNEQLEKELLKLIEHLKKQQNSWEERQKKLLEEHYPTTLNALKSIPGIGPKTAMMLIVATDNFRKFSNYRQLVAYVGFSPRIRQSGSSIRGRGAICKMGNALLRKLLYMCTWTAQKCNKTCKALAERLATKGKPSTIAHKLLKQAFAIANSQQAYNPAYQAKPCL
ncbi:MAG: transposase [Cyanobacteria bacterium J06576_12]